MTKYKIIFNSHSEKQLRNLTTAVRDRILLSVNKLAIDPRPSGCEKMSGKKNQWRIRIGDYRVIYIIQDAEIIITIIEIGHRKEVYR